MSMTMSILGLYNYDQTIFDGMVLPEEIEKDDVINNICMELGGMELLYPSADMMRLAIGIWSKKNLNTWNELCKTLHFEYNPIENYDRKEEWIDGSVEKGKFVNAFTNKSTNKNTGTDTEELGVSAYNSSEFQPREKNTTTYGSGNETSGEGTNGGSNENSKTGARNGRAHGNIGVTTTQAMIEEQRKVVRFNVIDEIVNSFKYKFCLLVY